MLTRQNRKGNIAPSSPKFCPPPTLFDTDWAASRVCFIVVAIDDARITYIAAERLSLILADASYGLLTQAEW